MAEISDAQLRALSERIRGEGNNAANTALRVGNLLVDIIDSKANLDELPNDYFRKNEFINQSSGGNDSGKPVILNASNQIDASLLPVSTGGGGTSDHGDLTGLGDDDHAQYHNDSRGDIRYFQKTEHINSSSGALDSGKPIILGTDGLVSRSMINGSIDIPSLLLTQNETLSATGNTLTINSTGYTIPIGSIASFLVTQSAGSSFTLSLSGAGFDINGRSDGKLISEEIIPTESTSRYYYVGSFTSGLRVVIPSNLSGSTGTPVNSAPTSISISSQDIDENNLVGDAIGSLSSPGAFPVPTFTLVSGAGDTDNSSFDISGTNLTALESFDFETKSIYSVRLRSTNNEGLFENTINININDVNDTIPTPTSLVITNDEPNKTKITFSLPLKETVDSIPNVTRFTESTGKTCTLIEISGNLVTLTWDSSYSLGDPDPTVSYDKLPVTTFVLRGLDDQEPNSFVNLTVSNNIGLLGTPITFLESSANATVVNNQITKNSGTGNAWNSGGISNETFTGDGEVIIQVGDTVPPHLIFGLTDVSTKADFGFGSLVFGFFISNSNPFGTAIQYVEDGVNGAVGVTDQVLIQNEFIRIRRVANVITASRSADGISWTDFYTFTNANTSDMRFDISINNESSSARNIVINQL